jgi:DNA replication protein DnaC
LLSELRLPAIKLKWAKFAEQADKEGWPAARFLAALAEHEIADRGRRRIERHLAEARLPVGKTLSSFDFEAVPMVSKAQVMALTAGDSSSAGCVPALEPGSSRRRTAPRRDRVD